MFVMCMEKLKQQSDFWNLSSGTFSYFERDSAGFSRQDLGSLLASIAGTGFRAVRKVASVCSIVI